MNLLEWITVGHAHEVAAARVLIIYGVRVVFIQGLDIIVDG